jgi:MFS family permease
MVANVSIAIIQFNIASVYSLMAQEFRTGVPGLGFAASAMFLGVFVSEVPGGILETRVGARNAMIYSMLLTSLSVLLTSLSGSFSEVVLFRFISGVGIGSSFPPAVVLMTRRVKRGSEGVGVGLLSSSFNLGGVLGLLGWALLGVLVGWRESILLSGIFCLALAITIRFYFPKIEPGISRIGLKPKEALIAISKNNELLLVTIALFGIGASASLNWSFEVYFLESTLNLQPGLAGLVVSAGPLLAIASPVIGRLYDRVGKTKFWFALATSLVGAGLIVTSLDTLLSGIVASLLVGIGSAMAYIVGLTAAREAGKSVRSEHESIAVGFADSVSLLGGFIAPISFSYIVLKSGYSVAWITGSLFAFVLVIPFLAFPSRATKVEVKKV